MRRYVYKKEEASHGELAPGVPRCPRRGKLHTERNCAYEENTLGVLDNWLPGEYK
jgi:hypothetical protein